MAIEIRAGSENIDFWAIGEYWTERVQFYCPINTVVMNKVETCQRFLPSLRSRLSLENGILKIIFTLPKENNEN